MKTKIKMICSFAKAGNCHVLNCKHQSEHKEMDECISTWCSRKNDLLKCVKVKVPSNKALNSDEACHTCAYKCPGDLNCKIEVHLKAIESGLAG